MRRPLPIKILSDALLGQQLPPDKVGLFPAVLPGVGTEKGLLWVWFSAVVIVLVGMLMSVITTLVTVGLGQIFFCSWQCQERAPDTHDAVREQRTLATSRF